MADYVKRYMFNAANGSNTIIVTIEEPAGTPVGVAVDYTARYIEMLSHMSNLTNEMITTNARLNDMINVTVGMSSNLESGLSRISKNTETLTVITGIGSNAINTIKNIVTNNTGIRVTSPYDHIPALMQLSALADANTVFNNVSPAVANSVNAQKAAMLTYLDIG